MSVTLQVFGLFMLVAQAAVTGYTLATAGRIYPRLRWVSYVVMTALLALQLGTRLTGLSVYTSSTARALMSVLCVALTAVVVARAYRFGKRIDRRLRGESTDEKSPAEKH